MLTVGCVLREGLPITKRFVEWYLREGADRIILCFDDPADPAIAVYKDHPKVEAVPCDDAFWHMIGSDPSVRFVRRQNFAMSYFYRQQEAGWYFYVDADELLYLHGRTLKQELEGTPADVRSVAFLPAEHIQSPDHPKSAQFRLPMSREAVTEIYGARAGLMQKRQGLSGHTEGKTANRVGFNDLVLRQHFMQRRDGEIIRDRVLGADDGAYLLHFFDQGYALWREKLPWRLGSRGIPGRMKGVLNALLEMDDPEPALRAFYAEINVFNAERLQELARFGAHFELPLDDEMTV